MTLFWLVVGGIAAVALWFGGYATGLKDGRLETRMGAGRPTRRGVR